MSEIENVKKKIIALLAKTEDRGANEHEALAAAQKAAELMAHYEIEATELDFKSKSCLKKKTGFYKYGQTPIGDRFIVDLARLCDCKCWGEPRAEIPQNVFFGYEQDAEIAVFLFKTISRAIWNELEAFKKSDEYYIARDEGTNGKTLCTSFLFGMEVRISKRLEIMTAQKKNDIKEARGTDLVIVKSEQVESELSDLGLNLRSKKMTSRARHRQATNAGRAAGDRVNIGTALNSNEGAEAIAQ